MDTCNFKQNILRPLKDQTDSVLKKLGRVTHGTVLVDPPIEESRAQHAFKGGSINKLWTSILEKVEVFATLSKHIIEVYPWAEQACSALASVDRPKHQEEQHTAMSSLLIAMDDLYEFVINTNWHEPLYKYRKALLKDMSLKTAGCADYIHLEVEFTRFWNRAGSNVNPGSQMDQVIREFHEVFVGLRENLSEGSSLEAKIHKSILMMASRVDMDRECLKGTRLKILNALQEWVENPTDTARVFFLLGGVGTGKSTIAHSLAAQFMNRHSMRSFISFDNSFLQYSINSVIRTIAHDLAHWNHGFRGALADILNANRDLEQSNDISEQWEWMVVQPLKKITLTEPVLVIIDGFDACSPPGTEERRVLLQHLTEYSRELPETFRIIVTSHPQHDVIMASESDRRHITHHSLDSEKADQSDIERYVRWQLSLSLDPNTRLDDEDVQLLVSDTQGLFQWAAMACRAIVNSPDGFHLRLKERIDWHDIIYRELLKDLFTSDHLIDMFRTVITLLFCASSPLSIDVLNNLHHFATGAEGHEVTCVLERMGSLLSGVYQRTTQIFPLHPSLREFLTNPDRSGKWFIDVASGHRILALACFRIMNRYLAFNMCKLETSSVLNCKIPNLKARIATSIPQSLSYAACNWQHHLPESALSSALQKQLNRFLLHKLLFWFELLSLLGALDRAVPSLEAALAVDQGSTRSTYKELLHDAILFIRQFTDVVASSAVHVYISALPFSSPWSAVRRLYLPRFHSLPVVQTGHKRSPQVCAIISKHTGWVTAVAYSASGQLIASGSGDGTLRIWDAETCTEIHRLPNGSYVYGVAFSPDSHHIAAVCRDRGVCVWDTTTGDAVRELKLAHGRTVAYSPCGNYIVSGNSDGHICVWSMAKRSMVLKLTHGPRVFSVTYSRGGQYLLSGGADCRVRVWHAKNGRPVGKPLEGHTGFIRSVLLSWDGYRIISGSEDATIRIWDFITQQTLHTISHPLLGPVVALSLSPDSTRVASGSSNTIQVWDLDTQHLVAGPFIGHKDWVNSAAFSPDGGHIVSGSNDRTIRVWLATTNMPAFEEVSPELSRVSSLACSPDGRRILTGKQDGSVHVWDANTGELIRADLKAHSDQVTCIKFSPKGGRFVTASKDKTLRVWDSATLEPLRGHLRGHTDWVMDIDFSPDGVRLVSCSDDRTLRIWSSVTTKCLHGPWSGHSGMVRCVTWSPNGRHIASVSGKSVLVWDAETGSAIGAPLMKLRSVWSVSWSSDSQYLMTTSGRTIAVWDVQNGVPAGEPLDCRQSMVWCARYSPNGRHIVSAGDNETIRMWDTQTKALVGTPLSYPFSSDLRPYHLEAELRPILMFSADGRRIMGRLDRSVIVWDVHAFTEPGVHRSLINLENPLGRSEYIKDASTGAWDGWIRGADGSLVMWVPHEYRESILWQGVVMVLGRKALTIDFTNACYGLDWDKFYFSE